MADGIVKQDSLPAEADGSFPRYRQNRRGELVTADSLFQLAADGRLFCSSDADENDRVTGETSYVATTPTFLLRVPAGVCVMPMWVNMQQTGSVAGGAISVYLSYDRVDRYSSGGTSQAVTPMHTGRPVAASSTLYSGATAAAATEARLLLSQVFDEDVGTDTNVTESLFAVAYKDFFPPFLKGPAAFMVFSYAASTGPTWEWSIGWLEIPDASAD